MWKHVQRWRSSKKEETRQLDFHLARGRLSGPEKDRILEQVLVRVQTESVSRVPRWALHSTWVGAVAVMLLVPAFPYLRHIHSDHKNEFREKGSSLVQRPRMDVACTAHCRQGEKLIFLARGLQEDAFFAAYAQGQNGLRIWYFPTEDGAMPRIKSNQDAFVLPQGAEIGTEHEPGLYRLHLFLMRHSLTRSEIRNLDSASKSREILAEESRTIEVRP